MSQFSKILYTSENGVAEIVLNRPEARNAQSIRMIDEIDAAFDKAEGDDGVRAIIVGGAGPAFSAGHDLKASRSKDGAVDEYEAAFRKRRELTETLFEHEYDKYVGKCLRIRNFPKPTIARVQGHCIAAGWMLASMCDLVVAGSNATFSNPVLRMASLGVELPVEFWDVGVRKAKELLFTGDRLSASDAHRLGFVNHVVENDELETFTRGLAEKIAKMPPVTVRMTKLALNKALDNMGQANSFWQYFMAHQLMHQTSEYKEMLASMRVSSESTSDSLKEFFEKRDTKFA